MGYDPIKFWDLKSWLKHCQGAFKHVEQTPQIYSVNLENTDSSWERLPVFNGGACQGPCTKLPVKKLFCSTTKRLFESDCLNLFDCLDSSLILFVYLLTNPQLSNDAEYLWVLSVRQVCALGGPGRMPSGSRGGKPWRNLFGWWKLWMWVMAYDDMMWTVSLTKSYQITAWIQTCESWDNDMLR